MAVKFSTDLNSQFIDIYRDYECLWNINCKKYRDKQCRDNAIDQIVLRMANMVNLSPCEVKKKIKSLRSTYLIEIKKIQDSLRSEASSDSIYKPKIAWFKKMDAFMKYVKNKRPTHNNLNETQSTFDDSAANEISFVHPKEAKMYQPSSKQNRLSEVKNILSELKALNEDIQQKQLDEYDVFGSYVATQLRQLSLEQSLIAREKIQLFLTQRRLQDIKRNDPQTTSPSQIVVDVDEHFSTYCDIENFEIPNVKSSNDSAFSTSPHTDTDIFEAPSEQYYTQYTETPNETLTSSSPLLPNEARCHAYTETDFSSAKTHPLTPNFQSRQLNKVLQIIPKVDSQNITIKNISKARSSPSTKILPRVKTSRPRMLSYVFFPILRQNEKWKIFRKSLAIARCVNRRRKK